MPIKTENIVLDKSFAFALSIINYYETLEQNKKFVVSHQLLKSGTSIGANIHEAQNSESRADFIHKLKIAAKEAEETKYWLLLCEEATNYPYEKNLLNALGDILRLLNSIINSAKQQM
jgi:TIGR02436 family protein